MKSRSNLPVRFALALVGTVLIVTALIAQTPNRCPTPLSTQHLPKRMPAKRMVDSGIPSVAFVTTTTAAGAVGVQSFWTSKAMVSI